MISYPRYSEVGTMRKRYYADPVTAVERFAKACREANELSKKTNYDIIVYKNCEGNFITEILKFCYIDIKNDLIRPLYCALAKYNVTPGSLKKIQWKLKDNHKTR